MNPQTEDLMNREFNYLTVIDYAGSSSGRVMWLCRCKCGVEKAVRAQDLKRGQQESCGCLKREKSRQRATTHGFSHLPEYRAWTDMYARCTDQKNKRFPDYGGRGIGVCDQWSSFQTFLSDMGHRPSSRYTIERIDNNGNYEPDNCRWATRLEQARNRRNNHRITLNGETKTLVEWCEIVGKERHLVRQRLAYGWDVVRAFTAPVRKYA